MEDTPAIRELTDAELAEIKRLVETSCANYDKPRKECLPLECGCYMLGKAFTGAFCKYFEQAVLPLSHSLVESLTGQAVDTKTCPVCDTRFLPDGNRVYCSPACQNKVKKQRNRAWMKQRRNKG